MRNFFSMALLLVAPSAFADFQVIKDGASYTCTRGGGKTYFYNYDKCYGSTAIGNGFQITGDPKKDSASCEEYRSSVKEFAWSLVYVRKNGACVVISKTDDFCGML